MAKVFDNLLEKLETRWSLAALIWQGVGAILSFGLPAWAAHATSWLNAYGPIAWVGCGFLGLLVFGLFLVLVSIFRDHYITASLKREFSRPTDSINPLEQMFQHRRIKFSDLVSPIESVIRNKTFIDCELLGPANLLLFGGTANSVQFVDCNAALIKDGITVPNSIALDGCNLLRGKIFRCTILVPESAYAGVRAALPPAIWMTLDPPALASVAPASTAP